MVSAGFLAHLTLDQMWRMPQTLFWPFLGTTFDKHNLSNYVANIFISLTTNPSAYIPEIIGGLILAWFDWKILKRHRLEAFVKYGIL